MSSLAANSRSASRRSQSITWRCTSGSGTRRRSGRGGKRPTCPTTPAPLLPLPPLPPDQEAIGQHHTDCMPVESRPLPTLVLVHPVPPVRIFLQAPQRRLRPEVTPGVLASPLLAACLPLPDQPADGPP